MPEWIVAIGSFLVKHSKFIFSIVNREKENAALKSENVELEKRLKTTEEELNRVKQLNDNRVHSDLQKEQELVDRLNEEIARN